ncbi:hypothetical protein F-VV10_0022 [Faustovirus]|nr:hypothetical protein F-VV10_0022 [Faustovirus]
MTTVAILPTEMVIEIANRATAATKGAVSCLNRHFHRVYTRPAYAARVRARAKVKKPLQSLKGENVNMSAYMLPNGQLDGAYREYYPLSGYSARRGMKPVCGVYARYINGLKHGPLHVYNRASSLVLNAKFHLGEPYGRWVAVFYGYKHTDLPMWDRANSREIHYYEKIWFDIHNHTLITWVKSGTNIISVKITRRANVDVIKARLFQYHITAHDYHLMCITSI